MRVEPPFEYNEATTEVSLFELDEESEAGSTVIVTGWGKTHNGTLADQLQSLTIFIIEKSASNAVHEKFGGLSEGQICAADHTGTKDMCNGDSGGPLLVDNRQAGIVSWSDPGCALIEHPGVYTEAARYRDWIEKRIRF